MTALTVFVCALHLAAFVAEALLWMHPSIHAPVLTRLGGLSTLDPHSHALVLKSLFVNQGFYNLFLALAGIFGLALVRRGRTQVGYTLIVYMCLSAVGAGLVLALSTSAYVGAFLQAVPALAALAMLRAARSRGDQGARSLDHPHIRRRGDL